MGTYYKWICRAREEQLDPEQLDESIKWPWGPKTIRALRYAVMFGPWIGQAVELLSDHDDLYYDIEPEPFGGLAADRQSQADQRGWLDIAKFCLRGAESIGDA